MGSGKYPGEKECRAAMVASQAAMGPISRRDKWETIKKKVIRMMQKKGD